MNFQFTKEQERFRQEVRNFLDKELTSEWKWTVGSSRYEEEVQGEERCAFYRSFQRKLGEKGWLSLCWPREYGGQERSRVEFAILRDEIGYYGAPGLPGLTYSLLAPMLLKYGTEEQKREYLPPLSRGELLFCQGFSEPNAGSDVASLTTHAVEEGDYFVIDGQKCWTTAAHFFDWGFFLVRTNPNVPKHQGLSMLLVKLNTPGITKVQLYDLAGLPAWQEIFFDRVKVPKHNIVGERNRGWQVAISVLNDERSGIAWLGPSRRALERLIKYVVESKPLSKDPIIRQQLASLAIEVEISRLACYFIADMQDKGVNLVSEASLTKNYVCRTSDHIAQAGINILGLFGQLEPGSKWAPFDGSIERTFLSYPMWTLAGGCAEVQSDIVARMILDPPR
ncbi:acyl-CoA dehydrogenase family protein [Chloroflexota bacterium]